MITKYKMYKDGKKLVIGAIAVAGITAATAMTTQVSADTTTSTSTATSQSVDSSTKTVTAPETDATTNSNNPAPATNPASGAADATKPATVSSTAEKSTVPTTAGTNVTQDQAKDAVDKAQTTVKGDADAASKSGVDVTTGKPTDVTINDDNAASKTNDILSDLNKQDQAVKDATAKQKSNDQAYTKATADQKDASTKGQADLDKSTSDLDKQIDATKKAGIEVSVEVSKTAPEYKSLKGLEGQNLLDAMAYNIDLYKKAVASGVATQDQDTATLAKLTAEYKQKQADYEQAKADLADAVSKGQADLQNSTANLDQQIDDAKKNKVDVTVTTSDQTPKYIDTTGLEGEALKSAIQKNIVLYSDAIKQAIAKQDQNTASLKTKLAAYQKALSDYNAGISTNTGLKWASNTTVTAGSGAQKLTGNEQAISFADGTIKSAAKYAIQGSNLNQNTDANFNNLFKINGTGSITIHNTTNGDVTLTFSNINAPSNTGTYVAIWGADDGGIAWGVFATYNGTAQGGAGEQGGGSAVISSGNILDYVYSYDLKLQATGNLTVATLNDIDNNQTITTNGLNGKVTTGKNVSASGNNYTAGSGDVSQGSNGNLSSNGVRWEWDNAGQLTFSIHHSTSDRNDTSIVGGAFGSDSQIPKKPVAPSLSAEKVTVEAPKAPDAPTAPKAEAHKLTVEVLPAAEKPTQQKVAVHYYSVTKTPKVEKTAVPVKETPVSTASVLPTTHANEDYDATQMAMAGLAATLMAVGLAGAKRKYMSSVKNAQK